MAVLLGERVEDAHVRLEHVVIGDDHVGWGDDHAAPPESRHRHPTERLDEILEPMGGGGLADEPAVEEPGREALREGLPLA